MTKVPHEPCKSRGDCYHSRAGRIGGPIGWRKMQATWGKTKAAQRVWSRAGRIGGLIGWRKMQATWGKTEDAQRVWSCAGRISGRKSVKSGQLFKNGGGTPCATVDGKYKTESMDEAAFYAVALELGGEPSRPPVIILPDGRSYTPDFQLKNSVLGLPANVPLELKRRKSYFHGNIEKARKAGAVVVFYEDVWEQ